MMPIFFFNVVPERSTADRISADLPDIETAKHYAMGLASTILHGLPPGNDSASQQVRIEDEQGVLLDSVHLREQ